MLHCHVGLLGFSQRLRTADVMRQDIVIRHVT